MTDQKLMLTGASFYTDTYRRTDKVVADRQALPTSVPSRRWSPWLCRLDVDGQPLGVDLFRDATKPYIRLTTLVALGVLLAGLLVVDWANGSTRLLGDSIGRAATLGAIIGVFVAYSDVAVGVDASTIVVRNPFLFTRVPLSLVEAVDARLGVYLRLRDRRRLAVRGRCCHGTSLRPAAQPAGRLRAASCRRWWTGRRRRRQLMS